MIVEGLSRNWDWIMKLQESSNVLLFVTDFGKAEKTACTT